MSGFILWLVIVGTGGVSSQQAVFFKTMTACETAKAQMLVGLKDSPGRHTANCVALDAP